MVDAEDLSTLAAERYISGFLIDAACLRYSEEPVRKNSLSLYLRTVISTNLGFNQKCAFSTNKVEALPFKNGSWWCCMDPYSNPRTWQPLVSPLPKYGTAASILWWWLKTESSYQHHSTICWRLYQKPNGISPFQFSGLECPNSHYLEKVELVVAFVWPRQSDFIDNPADNGIPHFHWSFHDMGSHRQRLLYHFTQWK